MRWLLLDKFIECEPGVRAVAIKNFSLSDPFFMDHFPNFPTVPGVLQIEMVAQAGGKCIRLAKPEILPILGTVRAAKFIKRIEPGDQCRITVEISKLRSAYAMASGFIEVSGIRVSEIEVMYALLPSSHLGAEPMKDPVIDAWRARQGELR